MVSFTRLKGILIVSILVLTSLIAVNSQAQVIVPVQQGGWELQESGVTADLNGISVISQNHSAIAGSQGIILNTIDAGSSWVTQDSGVQDDLYDISYYDDSTAVAVGNIGIILTTDDTGQTWDLRQTGMMETYYSAQMLTDTIGFIGGVDAIHEALFLWTTTGWNYWDWMGFWIDQGGTRYHARFLDIHFINQTYGLGATYVNNPNGGAIVLTTDGGATWETKYITNQATFHGLAVTNAGTAFAVGDHGMILKSTDFGQTWTELSSGVANTLNSIACLSDSSAIAVGSGGVIIRTDDGGSTWAPQASGVYSDLFSIGFADSLNGWVVGQSGVILHTSTGGMPVDSWPPVTVCMLNGVQDGGSYLGDVTVVLSASDNLSGVAQTVFSVDGGAWMNYTSSFIVSKEGDHEIRFYSIDNAGNVEPIQISDFSSRLTEITFTGGLGVKVHVMNRGSVVIEDQAWTLSLKGGLILIGKASQGTLSLQPGEDTILKIVVVGLGRTQMTFSTGLSEKAVSASVLFFFTRFA
jgi:photosystem II stability/assembly factor-like uncharacterized protein